MSCRCCSKECSYTLNGLYESCYFFLYNKKLAKGNDGVEKYGDYLTIRRFISIRPLTRNEIGTLVNLIEDRLVTKMPHGFWSGIYSYENSINALIYWCYDVKGYSKEYLTNPNTKEIIKEELRKTPLSNLVHNNCLSFTDLYRDVMNYNEDLLVGA